MRRPVAYQAQVVYARIHGRVVLLCLQHDTLALLSVYCFDRLLSARSRGDARVRQHTVIWRLDYPIGAASVLCPALQLKATVHIGAEPAVASSRKARAPWQKCLPTSSTLMERKRQSLQAALGCKARFRCRSQSSGRVAKTLGSERRSESTNQVNLGRAFAGRLCSSQRCVVSRSRDDWRAWRYSTQIRASFWATVFRYNVKGGGELGRVGKLARNFPLCGISDV